MRARPRLLAAVPVIVPAAVKRVLAVREGDDVAEIVQIFADLHEIPDGIVPGLTAKVADTLAGGVLRPSTRQAFNLLPLLHASV